MNSKMMMLVAFGAALALPVSGASAQEACSPAVAHAHLETATVAWCDENGHATCEDRCVCNRGYHPQDADQPASSTNPCVRDARDWGSYSDPLCAAGAVRNARGECECSTALAPRVHRHITIVTREAAELIRDQIEDYDRLRSRGRTVALMVCTDPLAAAGASGSPQSVITDAYAQGLRILCAAPETATDEELLELCTETRALIDSIEERTTIHYGDRDYTINDFMNEVVIVRLGQILELLGDDDGRGPVIPRLHEVEDQVAALRARPDGGALRSLADATHLRVGGFGRLGFSTAGPATGAGGASAELLFRFGDLPIGAYGRLEFGGQETGWGVGASLYLSGGAGLTYFTGGRRDTTVSLGLFAEDLLEPFADDPAGIGGSEIGVALGAELSASLPLPGDAYWVRIRAGISISYSERYHLDQGAFSVLTGAYIAPTLGLEFQPDW